MAQGQRRSAGARWIARGAALGLGALAALAGPTAAVADSLTGVFLAARQAMRQNDSAAAARYFERAVRMRPAEAAFRERAVFYGAASGDVPAAVGHASALIQAQPENRIAQIVLAVDAVREERYAAAAEFVEGEGQGSAGRLLRSLLSAWIAAGQGDRDAAEGYLGRTGEEPFFKLVGRYHAALIATQDADWTAAIAAFEEANALVRRPTPRMALGYAAALQRAGRVEEATAAVEASFAADPTEPSVRAARASLAAGETLALAVPTAPAGAAEAFYDLALALAQEEEGQFGLFYARLAMALRPEFDDATLLAGEIQERLRQFPAAAAIYAQVPPTSPHYGSAQVSRAIALARHGREDEGLEALRRLAAQSPDDPNVHFAMGDFFQRSDEYAACARSYEEGLRRLETIGARYWRSYYRLGACYERNGQWDLAETNLRRALELRPGQADVLNYLGYSMVELGEPERLDEAKALIQEAVAASPDSGYIVDSLGWVLYRMGDYAAAVTHLERAAELEPTEPVINDHLGDALWRVGRKTEARFHWSRALSFDPDEAESVRIKRKLEVGLDQVLEEESALAPPGARADAEGEDAPRPDPAQGG